MAHAIGISAIIPTYNRRELVQCAIDSALAQTCPVDEIIVVDDGSTDGTEDALAARYGGRIRYHRQQNAGVSAARNAGMRLARGRYIALLDSDDLWLPDKTRLQREWLDAHPDFGMVLCDVERIEADGTPINVFRRRDVLKEDGWALQWLLANPSLVPASAMFRREVFETSGGFDPSLRTAEDIDFHLRVAKTWRIGVVEQSLVKAMRGHDGLSAESSTYDDYVKVVERAAADAEGVVDEALRRHALSVIYARNARGMAIRRRWRDAWRLACAAWSYAQNATQKRELLGLIPFSAKRILSGWLRR
ncbi:MAG: glycosyltransferase family 2 protein [Lysobacteraceae bacterium]|nr:MAG: glycosyltransferase family 2 protein [Xanthomonadaceae bacterium]